jgi:hypothetical protein
VRYIYGRRNLCGIYGAIQFLIGAVPAIRGPERTVWGAVAITGALFFAVGALIAWVGRRLRRSADR